MIRLFALAMSLGVSACGDGAPEHYYVLCENVDGAGWRLIDHQRDSKGYILSCTYQSPDKRQSRTARCTSNGCD
jgi:hypothetical protein